MIKPGQIDLRAYRNVLFRFTFEYRGLDMTGAAIFFQVRQYRDAPGAALIDLEIAAPDTDGISIAVDTVDGLPVSTVTVFISRATLDAVLPFPGSGAKAGDDVRLVHDLVYDGPGLDRCRLFQGAFILEPGVVT